MRNTLKPDARKDVRLLSSRRLFANFACPALLACHAFGSRKSGTVQSRKPDIVGSIHSVPTDSSKVPVSRLL